MSRKLFLMCLISALSITSAYAKCDGGEEVTNTAGTTFCKSNVTMNWWSAAAWCKANGMQLASMYELCPSWDGNSGVDCLELRGTAEGGAWSSTASDEEHAFAFRLSDGYIHVGYNDGIRHRDDFYSALCH